MEAIGSIFKYIGYGMGGLFVVLIIITFVFGKRVITKWDYEAKFRNNKRREIGEFDIKMKKYDGEDTEFTLKEKFVLRHPELSQGKQVSVYLDNELVMEGNVEHAGKIYLSNKHLKSKIESPEAGQICRVMCSAIELYSEPIYKD